MSTAMELRRQVESALAGRVPAAFSFRPPVAPELLSCGMLEVDSVLGGGLPLGAITELTGAQSSGRTTLVLSTLAAVTAQDESCAYVDASDALNPVSAAALGVDLRRLLWVRTEEPRAGEARAKADVAAGPPFPAAAPASVVGSKRLGGAGWCHPRDEVVGLHHAVEAAVIALRLTAHPARPPVAQQGLFAAQAPEAGRLEILLARLRKLVGEGRVGAPELLDTHAPEPFRVADFEIAQSASVRKTSAPPPQHAPAMRMVRPPRAIAVELRGDAPAAMHYEGHRLILQAGSGPWRTSGTWWTHPAWCREEWDVVLKEEPQRCLRLAHDPGASCWYVIGIYD